MIRTPADEHFEGASNDLVEQRTFTVRSACQFDLSMYPFDVQACRVVVRSVLGIRSLRLHSEGVHFLVGGGIKSFCLFFTCSVKVRPDDAFFSLQFYACLSAFNGTSDACT